MTYPPLIKNTHKEDFQPIEVEQMAQVLFLPFFGVVFAVIILIGEFICRRGKIMSTLISWAKKKHFHVVYLVVRRVWQSGNKALSFQKELYLFLFKSCIIRTVALAAILVIFSVFFVSFQI